MTLSQKDPMIIYFLENYSPTDKV